MLRMPFISLPPDADFIGISRTERFPRSVNFDNRFSAIVARSSVRIFGHHRRCYIGEFCITRMSVRDGQTDHAQRGRIRFLKKSMCSGWPEFEKNLTEFWSGKLSTVEEGCRRSLSRPAMIKRTFLLPVSRLNFPRKRPSRVYLFL